jgi:diacylglycerol kinase family enzyme
LIEMLEASGHDVEHYCSKREWRGMQGDLPVLLVVAGGDGTIRKVAKSIVDRPVPLAVLPTGTANNVAKALGLADVPLPELMKSWASGRFTSFDVGMAHGPWGTDLLLESAGAGLLAATIADIDAGESDYVNGLGPPDARLAAATDVFERLAGLERPFRARVRMDDREIDRDFLLLEVMNFGAAGPDLRLSPRADPSDGVFDVVLIEPEQQDLLAAFLSALRSGAADRFDMPVHHARRVEVSCEPCRLHLDDTLWGSEAHEFSATVRPSALTFVVPA